MFQLANTTMAYPFRTEDEEGDPYPIARIIYQIKNFLIYRSNYIPDLRINQLIDSILIRNWKERLTITQILELFTHLFLS